jgi:hypothetical protein
MNGNSFMSWVLRSPIHGLLSNSMMLITVKGRKTDRKYTTPVGFYEKDGNLWVLTSRERTWWRNLKGGAPIELLLKRKPVNGFAEPELDDKTVRERLVEYVQYIPASAKPMGIRVVDNKPNADDIARVAKDRLFVKIKLSK